MIENRRKKARASAPGRQGLRRRSEKPRERDSRGSGTKNTLQTEGFLLRETATAEPCVTETKKHAWVWNMLMEIPERNGRGEILSLKVSTDIEIGTVRILEGKDRSKSREKNKKHSGSKR